MSLIAAIDIGTSSVKTCLLDVNKKEIIANSRIKHNFRINENLRKFPNYCQHNVETIVTNIQKTLSEFDVNLRKNIKLITMCGQMHGCVLWNNKSFYEFDRKIGEFRVNTSVSDLYNWQDNRCTDQFIASLPKPDSYVDEISSGFGCATIFWLQRNSKDFINLFNSSGTVMDLIIAIICDLERPVMSTQNATGWGYFDPIGHSWNENILKSNEFPTHLLPIVKKSGSLAGHTKFEWLGIETKTPVMVAFGDMQCATYANLKDYPNNAVLSVSTSMQFSVLMDKKFIPMKKKETKNKSIDYFPYFDDQYLSVAASLNGGNVLQSFINSIKNIIENITDVKVSDDQIWANVIESYEKSGTDKVKNEIIARPTLFGERYNTSLRASVQNLSQSIDLNAMIIGFCKGLIENIFEMMSTDYLKEAGVQRVIGTGGALLKNPILKEALERKLDIPVIYIDSADADVGCVWIGYYYYKSSLF